MGNIPRRESSNHQIDPQERIGGYAAIPCEMVEFLMSPTIKITSEQYKIIFFFIRRLQGWSYLETAARMKEITDGTSLLRQHATPALKDLISKKILNRRHGVNKIYGEHIYSFNEETFGRVTATGVLRVDRRTVPPKKKIKRGVTESVTPVSPSELHQCNPSSYSSVTEEVTPNSTIAATDGPLAVVIPILKPSIKILNLEKTEESFTLLGKETGNPEEEIPFHPEAKTKIQQIMAGIIKSMPKVTL
jgi:hypothetical protein